MHAIPLPGDRRISRTPMWAWGWAMLLVVLLSAAPTGGAPRTALIGSAFDPATVYEVLTPKRSRLSSAVETGARKKRDSSVPLGAFVTRNMAWAPAASFAFAGLDRAWLHRNRGSVPPEKPRHKAHAPRAPPLV